MKPSFDNTWANLEGWGLFNAGEIQRLDDPASIEGHPATEPVFASDEAAVEFVKTKAREGSAYHQAALNFSGKSFILEGGEQFDLTGWQVEILLGAGLIYDSGENYYHIAAGRTYSEIELALKGRNAGVDQ